MNESTTEAKYEWHGPFAPIEQSAGEPLVEPVDAGEIDAHRQATYESYENFLRQEIAARDAARESSWPRDYSSTDAYLRSIEPLRDRLKAMLGFWVEPAERTAPRVINEAALLETENAYITRLTYEVLPGLQSYAVRLRPKTPGPHPPLLMQHGYFGTPELMTGLTPTANVEGVSYRSVGLRAVRRGYHVIAPHHPDTFSHLDETQHGPHPGHPNQNWHYGNNRLNRLCVAAGGTRFGLDMMVSSRAVDLLLAESAPGAKLGMYGLSRGGQAALFLPALDTRIMATVCAAFFNRRLLKLIGPARLTNYLDWFDESQFIRDFVRWFSDADLVSLIAPRAFAVEAGVHEDAAPLEYSHDEFGRARVHFDRLGLSDRIEFIAHAEGHVCATSRAFEFLETHLR